MLPQAFGAGAEDWFSCMAPGYHVPWPWAITIYFKRCLTNPNYTSGPHLMFWTFISFIPGYQNIFWNLTIPTWFIESWNVDFFCQNQLKGPLTCHRFSEARALVGALHCRMLCLGWGSCQVILHHLKASSKKEIYTMILSCASHITQIS